MLLVVKVTNRCERGSEGREKENGKRSEVYKAREWREGGREGRHENETILTQKQV